MNRKALFFDIDGTLMTDDTKEIPKSAAMALQRARELGHLVFVNSGRARCLMKEVERDVPVDGYLCGCGTYIEIGGQVILHHVISAERRLELQRAILDFNLDGMLEGRHGCWVHNQVSRMPQVEQMKFMVGKSGVLGALDWRREPADYDKFCALADEKSDAVGFLEFVKTDMMPIDRGNGLYECVPSGFDKATAMEYILEYFGIPWEESYAFGDSSNDLAMIRYACNAVIMEVHDKVLEPYASFVTRRVEEDGIAYAFEKLNII